MSRPSSDSSSGSESSSDSEGSSSDESIPDLEKQQDTEPKAEGGVKKNETSKSSPESSLWYENIPPLITGKQRGQYLQENIRLLKNLLPLILLPPPAQIQTRTRITKIDKREIACGVTRLRSLRFK